LGTWVLFLVAALYRRRRTFRLTAGKENDTEAASGRFFCLDGVSPSTVNFAAISAHLAEILFDQLLAVFKGFLRRVTPVANGEEKDQPTKQKRHSTDHQRQTNSTHLKNPKRDSLTWSLDRRNVDAPPLSILYLFARE
jgi:hypothetical protein